MNVATAVGQPDQMQEIVDGVKQQIADAAAAHPEFQGKTAMCVTPYEGLFVYGPEDPRSRMLVDLGFAFPSELFGGEQEEFGESLSAERTSDLDQVDVSVWLDLETDAVGEEGLRPDHLGGRGPVASTSARTTATTTSRTAS